MCRVHSSLLQEEGFIAVHRFEGEGDGVVGRVRYVDGRVWINASQYFTDVPRRKYGIMRSVRIKSVRSGCGIGRVRYCVMKMCVGTVRFWCLWRRRLGLWGRLMRFCGRFLQSVNSRDTIPTGFTRFLKPSRFLCKTRCG